MGIEKMLRMYLLQIWFNLSDPATEDAIYDSYAMRKFTGIDFMSEVVPDETTLCKFRHLLEENGLNKLFFDAINRVMVQTGHMMKGGTIVDVLRSWGSSVAPVRGITEIRMSWIIAAKLTRSSRIRISTLPSLRTAR